MNEPTRRKWAENFRSISYDAILSAQQLLGTGRYRDSCSRAWFSIYQIVCAGTYLKLQQRPPRERDNWNHTAVKQLLTDLLRAGHARVENSFLIECVPDIMNSRVVADYSPDDEKFGKRDAVYAIAAAERIREAVLEVMGL